MTLPEGARDPIRVSGGDINEAWRVTLPGGGVAFVKTRAHRRQGEYAREARSLMWLKEPGALQIPNVIDVSEDYLALTWVEQGTLDAHGAEELGRGLAILHASGAPSFGDWTDASEGASRQPAVIGSLALPNEPCSDWPAFYVERRLLPALAAAVDADAISPRGAATVRKLCERIDAFAGPLEPPARLHGDLWSGNVIAGVDGRPWLIDPTAYGGHREVDLAMLRLFGAPSERVFAAYSEVTPLADGAEDRVRLWQLLPILVHAALFRGAYGDEAERIAMAYVG